MGFSINGGNPLGNPLNRLSILEKPMKMDVLGVALFQETAIDWLIFICVREIYGGFLKWG